MIADHCHWPLAPGPSRAPLRIGRTVPPAAAPVGWRDLCGGVAGALTSARSIRARTEEMKRLFGVRHVFLVSSGTAALVVALMALRTRSRRTQVVIPAYTCFSVPAAVLKAGLRPTLCDINPTTFDFDHEQLEQTVTEDTLCVIVHHLFGVASDVGRTRRLCQLRGASVVEDAAQAMGAESNGHWLGTLGDVGIFSLGRGKNITCGAGGVIVTNSDVLGETLGVQCQQLPPCSLVNALKNLFQVVIMAIFIRPSIYWIPSALPFLRLGQTIFPKNIPLMRLSGIQAGLLRNWHSRLRRSNRTREHTAAAFGRRLSLAIASEPPRPYVRLPIMAATPEERLRIYAHSQHVGLGLSLAYPTPISEIPELRGLFDGQRVPGAQQVARHLLTLPTHHLVSDMDARAIAQCLTSSS